MIDVREHFYDDDPEKGHPDVRTRLRDVSYFFLGNGRIQAAVQFAPSGEGSALGLLIFNPEVLGKKREALTFDPKTGLESTMLRVRINETSIRPVPGKLAARWDFNTFIPVVHIEWQYSSFVVTERLCCPDDGYPGISREVRFEFPHPPDRPIFVETGLNDRSAGIELSLNGKTACCEFLYTLNPAGSGVDITASTDNQASNLPGDENRTLYNGSCIEFGEPALDRFFHAAKVQLPAVISSEGVVDASIWQYNREWVRDTSMMCIGLTVTGYGDVARPLLIRLLRDFVTPEGQCVDSSEIRDPEEVELDQNGELLTALNEYVLWTGDLRPIRQHWEKIHALAEYPLKERFRHMPSGLLANTREYWERHRVHGIMKGMELAHQTLCTLGLIAAADLARRLSHEDDAGRWEKAAKRLQTAMLEDTRYGLVYENRLIKRRSIDGSVQDCIQPESGAGLPDEVPLAHSGPHRLHPDASMALPLAFGLIPADSRLAARTLECLETLWEQAWTGGGYGRYDVSSEPDSPGAWPFPSLFIARAYAEAGKSDRIRKILRWLDGLPGAPAGSWFEFYGPRISPPFPQVGIPPWTWAEMLILCVRHILGVRPERDALFIRPRLLDGMHNVTADLPIRGHRIRLHIVRRSARNTLSVQTEASVVYASPAGVRIKYGSGDTNVNIQVG